MTNLRVADDAAEEHAGGVCERDRDADKDLKRLVRARMKKTGEAYTAARLQPLKKQSTPDYAEVAGMSDSAVSEQTGRTWAEWVGVLDAARAAENPHRQSPRMLRPSARPTGGARWSP